MFYFITAYQLTIFVLFLFLYNKIIFKDQLLNLSFFHYTYFFVFYFFGAGVLYADGGFENNYYFFSVTLYPLISILAMYTVNLIYKKPKNDLYLFSRMGLKYISLLVGVVVVAYVASLDSVPVMDLIRGDAAAASIDRSLVTKGYEGSKILYYLYRIVIDYLFIFLAIYVYFREGRFTLKLAFVLVLGVIVATLDTQKYPAMNMVLMLFVAVFTYNKTRDNPSANISLFINTKVILALSVSYLAIGIIWATVAGRLFDRTPVEQVESVIAHANSMVSDRLLFGQNRVLYVTYEIVPGKYDYFMGSTFANPLRLLPYEPIPFSYLTYDAIHPESIDGKVRGSGPAVFYSEIYANFGIVVSFGSMFAFGVFMQLVNNILISKNRFMIPYRFMWMNYMTLFALGFETIYNSEKFYFLLLMYFVFFSKAKLESIPAPHKAA